MDEEFINEQTKYYNAALQQDWTEVMKIFEEAHNKSEWLHSLATSSVTKTGGNNVLHLAALHGARDLLESLVGMIKEWTNPYHCMEALSFKNENGYTPLHYAASRGSLEMCKRIISDDYYFFRLVRIRNNLGETPLFLAALHGHKETFQFLHEVSVKSPSPSGITPWRRNDGDTILHCTISREYFDLSFQIIQMYKDQHIAGAANVEGIKPLHVLANKPSAFKSGTHFNWFTKVLYNCIPVELLQNDAPSTMVQDVKISKAEEASIEIKESPEIKWHNKREKQGDKPTFPQNYRTCLDIFDFFLDVVRRLLTNTDTLSSERSSFRVQIACLPPIYSTWMEFLKFVCGICGLWNLTDKKSEKEKHVWGSQVMDELIEEYYNVDTYMSDGAAPGVLHAPDGNEGQKDIMSAINYVSSSNKDVKKDEQDQQKQQGKTLKNAEIMTPLLTAAKNGVIEMVREILSKVPVAIHETTADKKNILLVAVENRQPHILEELKDHDVWDNMIQAVDGEGNNVLHLAARVSRFRPWRIAGSAMQMQWEIKWFKFVKSKVPKHLVFQTNKNEQIPADIFTEGHKQIVKEGSEWLKSTSESCSVVAALIAGVSFATSCNIPGGSNDQTGKPTLEGEPTFGAFAVTSLVSLCFSVTALVMFLSVLTSRQQPSDYRRDLPFKLLFGLTFLFASIVCMLASFCAAYFFMLKDKMHDVVFIIYAATCFPMSVYAVAQFPLYWDLLKAIFTDVPKPAHRGDLYLRHDDQEEAPKKTCSASFILECGERQAICRCLQEK